MAELISVPQGLEGVIVAETAISDIDGARGLLTYRGVDIGEVVARFSRWEDLLPWLIFGHEGSPAIPKAFRTQTPSEGAPMVRLMKGILDGPSTFAGPEDELAWLVSLAGTLVGVNPGDYDSAAAAYLSGLRGGTAPDASEVRALNAYWVMAAEHGLNASTFAVRVACSTATPLPLALVAGLATLAGPLHGGAPEGVGDLLDEAAVVSDLGPWLTEKVHRGERLMGFGHRVYRTRDPRAEALYQIFRGLASDHQAVDQALRVEEAALAVLRREKPERILATNVEFYAAALFKALGIPAEWGPVTFALGRLGGYTAHYHEERRTGRLIRPSSRYRADIQR